MKKRIGKIKNMFYKVFSIPIVRNSNIQKGKNVIIKNSLIRLVNSSTLIIEDGVIIENFDLFINNGFCIIGKNCILSSEYPLKSKIKIDKGKLEIKNNCVIKSNISCRFGGECIINEYTIFNYGYLRCDEKIHIGKFVMIGSDTRIFDTDTHQKLISEVRRKRTVNDYPFIGREYNKPNTLPVMIGDDVWIGENVTLLKGCKIGNGAVIGTSTTLSKLIVPENATVVSQKPRIIIRGNNNDKK